MQVIKRALEMKQLKTAFQGLTAAGLSSFIAANASAAGLSDLAASIDKTDILAGFMAIALLIGAILASRMGIRKVLGMIK